MPTRDIVALIVIVASTLLGGLVGNSSWANGDTAPDNLVQVFSGEKDACSKVNTVSIPGKNGRIEVRKGETKWVEFETLKSTFYCAAATLRRSGSTRTRNRST